MKLKDYISYLLDKYKWLFIYYELYSIFDILYIIEEVIKSGNKVLFISPDDHDLEKTDKFIKFKMYDDPSVINNLDLMNPLLGEHNKTNHFKGYDYIIFSIADHVLLNKNDMILLDNNIDSKILVTGYSKPNYSISSYTEILQNRFKHITLPKTTQGVDQLLRKFERKQKLMKLFNEKRTDI